MLVVLRHGNGCQSTTAANGAEKARMGRARPTIVVSAARRFGLLRKKPLSGRDHDRPSHVHVMGDRVFQPVRRNPVCGLIRA